MNGCLTYLHVFTGEAIKGKNYIDLRAQWLSHDDAVYHETYISPTTGRQTQANWIRDGGDQTHPPTIREPRHFATKGSMTLNFTGDNITVRIATAWGWGRGVVRIDGQAPTTISGVRNALDYLDCDEQAWPSAHTYPYVDVLLADNLPNGPHTLTITADNPEISGFICMTGFKVYDFGNLSMNMNVFINPAHNAAESSITIKNIGPDRIYSPSLSFPSTVLIDNSTAAPCSLSLDTYSSIGTISQEYLDPGQSFTRSFRLDVSAALHAGPVSTSMSLSAQYPSISGGDTTLNPIIGHYANDPELTMVGEWGVDTNAPGGLPRAYTNDTKNSPKLLFTSYDDYVELFFQRGYGYGTFALQFAGGAPVYESGTVSVGVNSTYPTKNGTWWSDGTTQNFIGHDGSMSMPISGPSTLSLTYVADWGCGAFNVVIDVTTLASVDCGIKKQSDAGLKTVNIGIPSGDHLLTIVTTRGDYTLGPFDVFAHRPVVIDLSNDSEDVFMKRVIGLGTGRHDLQLVPGRLSNDSFAIFVGWRFNWSRSYNTVGETINVTLNAAWPLPAVPYDVQIAGGSLVWNGESQSRYRRNYAGTDNQALRQIEVKTRFPTFIVCYQSGFEAVIDQYDVAVIEPRAVTRRQVAHWQSLGIKVLGYVSFGEELGEPRDVWESPMVNMPWRGDGGGPGGYARYYRKGGDLYGESSECNYDLRHGGGYGCAIGDGHYSSGTGRCTKACGHDWLDGYTTWLAGGACGGGKDRTNYWTRDAVTACSTATCPAYAPINSKCPNWKMCEGAHWGQDFSQINQSFPDGNAVWASFYIDPREQSGGWPEKLRNYYLPAVFGAPVPHTENLSIETHDPGGGQAMRHGFRVTHHPIDPDETISVVVTGMGNAVLTPGTNFAIDRDTGVFDLTNPPAGFTEWQVGASVTVSYSKLGLMCDGVFMDTVDTVDVYPSARYQADFAAMINNLKVLYPDKMFCSNRGFSILDNIAQSCSYVMFESWICGYNWVTDVYTLIDDDGSISYNQGVIDQIMRLRKDYPFDVLSLNYCHDADTDSHLRTTIDDWSRSLGFLTWSTTILLNNPRGNWIIETPGLPVQTNDWGLSYIQTITY